MSSLSTEISPDKRQKYEDIFKKLTPIDGKISGDQARAVFLKSELSVETLRTIWNLSDVDQDGSLDLNEFVLAMHLIYEAIDGAELPSLLPESLQPPPKMLALMPSAESMSQPSSSMPLALILPAPPKMDIPVIPRFQPPPPLPDWIITPEELARSDVLFNQLDTDNDSLVSGMQAKDIFTKTGLHHQVLATIWDLVDLGGTGFLNHEQFAVATRLINSQMPGQVPIPLPKTLPPELLPPSLRPPLKDPSFYEESNKLIDEFEKLYREKLEIDQECYQLQIESQTRANEIENLVRTTEQLQNTSESLEKQRELAEGILAELEQNRNQLDEQLSDIQAKINEEKNQIEELRATISNRDNEVQEQENELTKLRQELNELIREESSLQEQVQQNRTRLKSVEKENLDYLDRISTVARQTTILQDLEKKIQELVEEHEAKPEDETLKEKAEQLIKEVDEAMENADKQVNKPVLQPMTNLFPEGANSPPEFDPFGASKTDPFAGVSSSMSWGQWPPNFDSSKKDPFAVNEPQPNVDTEVVAAFDPFNDLLTAPKTVAPPTFTSSQLDQAFGELNIDSGPSEPPKNDSFMATSSAWPDTIQASNDVFEQSSTAWAQSPIKQPSSQPPPRPKTQPGEGRKDSLKNNSSVSSKLTSKSLSSSNNSSGKKSSSLKAHGNRASNHTNEDDQLYWAEQESIRLAKVEEERRQQEEADFQLALKLSQMT